MEENDLGAVFRCFENGRAIVEIGRYAERTSTLQHHPTYIRMRFLIPILERDGDDAHAFPLPTDYPRSTKYHSSVACFLQMDIALLQSFYIELYLFLLL
ncbi:hypothetical protein [Heyndrickxia coagulans]|uniref:hypothetical protein n=1 Tax=Heyndrickxia coagulans TaxID=1398 RepID=UPI0011D25118|nr:hypothetical protein [Heyndrickxia coagulans]